MFHYILFLSFHLALPLVTHAQYHNHHLTLLHTYFSIYCQGCLSARVLMPYIVVLPSRSILTLSGKPQSASGSYVLTVWDQVTLWPSVIANIGGESAVTSTTPCCTSLLMLQKEMMLHGQHRPPCSPRSKVCLQGRNQGFSLSLSYQQPLQEEWFRMLMLY